jgi:hypothetical protein
MVDIVLGTPITLIPRINSLPTESSFGYRRGICEKDQCNFFIPLLTATLKIR